MLRQLVFVIVVEKLRVCTAIENVGRPRDEPFGTTERPGTELGSFWDQARQTFGLLVVLTLNNLKKIGMSLVPTRFALIVIDVPDVVPDLRLNPPVPLKRNPIC